MQYTHLGRTGLQVSRLCLGTMNFGPQTSEADSFAIMDRALALEPRLIIADEPVSALDMSTQSQVVNLLLDLQERLGVAYLFISHNLAVVEHMSDRIAVMHQGKVVEYAPVEEIFRAPKQEYTRTLIDSVPYIPRPGGRHVRQPRLTSTSPVSANTPPPPLGEHAAG